MALAPTPQPRPAPSTAPRPAAAPAPRPSKLGGLTARAVPNPRRFFFYGTRKFGKSTLAADAPAPIFIDTMNATEHLHVARYPHPGRPWTWQDVLDALDDLVANDHGFKTLVIEDVGDLEQIIWRHMFENVPKPEKEGGRAYHIEDYGFGKGYKIANQFWRILSARLDDLRLKRKMHCILLGHSQIVSSKNPDGADYDTHQPQIYKDAAGILGADCDVIGFATFDDAALHTKGSRKVIGATGTRVVHLGHSASRPMVGSRLPLPDLVDIESEHPFRPFAEAMAQLDGASPAALRSMIGAEFARLGDTFIKADGSERKAEVVKAAVDAAGDDADALTRFLTTLRQAQPMPKTQETP